MRITFDRATADQENYPVFAELFRSIYESVRNGEKIDTLEEPLALLEPDDPDSSIASHCVEEQSLEKLDFYLDKLAKGHSTRFARLHALEASPGDEERSAQRIFYTIGDSHTADDLTSPAYAEAYRVCLHQGQGELYAHQCGLALMGNDFKLPDAMASAAEYEDEFYATLQRGRSMLYASLYAHAIVFYDRVDWAAAAYAWSYESQIKLGRSLRDADRYASIYEDYFDTYSSSDEMEEGSGDSEMTTVYTEAEIRLTGKPYKKDTYISQFVNCYYVMEKHPQQSMADWFSDVEAAADRKCAT